MNGNVSLRSILLALTLLGSACIAPARQNDATETPSHLAFDVASVKEDKSGDLAKSNIPLGLGDSYFPEGGLFSATNYSVASYIGSAYKLAGYQSRAMESTLPKWAKEKRFNIEARAGATATKDEMRMMMRTVLADRFKQFTPKHARNRYSRWYWQNQGRLGQNYSRTPINWARAAPLPPRQKRGSRVVFPHPVMSS